MLFLYQCRQLIQVDATTNITISTLANKFFFIMPWVSADLGQKIVILHRFQRLKGGEKKF